MRIFGRWYYVLNKPITLATSTHFKFTHQKQNEMTTNYQSAKSMLRAHAEYVNVQFRGDKPAIRQSINDYTDSICRDFDLNDHKRDLLANYACKLHPKN